MIFPLLIFILFLRVHAQQTPGRDIWKERNNPERRADDGRSFQKNQEWYGGVAYWDPANHTNQLNDIRVYCYDKSMDLYLRFDDPFHGYIYPVGSFERCYLFAGKGEREVNLQVSSDSCGLDHTYTTETGNLLFMDVRLTLQWHKDWIGFNDRQVVARCDRTSHYNKTVDMSSAKDRSSITTDNEAAFRPSISLDVLQLNRTGKVRASHQSVTLGSPLIVEVTVTDPENLYGVGLASCVAHDGLDRKGRNLTLHHTSGQDRRHYVSQLELVKDGCPLLPDLVGELVWARRRNHNIQVKIPVRAFGFPASSHVFVECEVRICYPDCPKKIPCHLQGAETVSAPSQPDDSALIQTVKLFRWFEVEEMHASRRHPEELGPYMAPLLYDGHCVPGTEMILTLIAIGFIVAIILVYVYKCLKEGQPNGYEKPRAQRPSLTYVMPPRPPVIALGPPESAKESSAINIEEEVAVEKGSQEKVPLSASEE